MIGTPRSSGPGVVACRSIALLAAGLALWSGFPGRDAHVSVSALAAAALAPAATTATIHPEADADTRGGSGGDQFIFVANRQGLAPVRGFLRFSLASIPAAAVVTDAELRLYLHRGEGESAIGIEVWRVTADWREDGLTWGNQPAAVSYASGNVASAPGWKNWDVTTLVQGWLSGSLPNHGVMLRGPEERSQYSRQFRSAEYSGSASDPQLLVTYTLPSEAAPAATAVPTAPEAPVAPLLTPRPVATATPTAPVPRRPAPTPAGSAPQADFFPQLVEVIQAIHNEDPADTSIDLVAGKVTLVRVYVGLTGVTSALRADGFLRAQRGGQQLEDCSQKVNTPDVIPGASIGRMRYDLDLTLNFIIPRGCNWIDEGDLLIRAEVTPSRQCSGCTDNDVLWQRFRFHPVRPLRVKPFRVRYDRADPPLLPTMRDTMAGFDFVRALYPTGRLDLKPTGAISTTRNLEQGTGCEALGDFLEDFRDSKGWESVDSNLAVVHPSLGVGGCGYTPGRYAAASAGEGTTYAHEMGHNFGLKHASNRHGEDGGGGWESWDYYHGGFEGPGWNNEDASQLIHPGSEDLGWHSHDFMSYGDCNDGRNNSGAPSYRGSSPFYCSDWISSLNYNRIRRRLQCADPQAWPEETCRQVYAGTGPANMAQAPSASGLRIMSAAAPDSRAGPWTARQAGQPVEEREYLVTNGRISDGRVEFRPFYRMMLPAGSSDWEGQGPYRLELVSQEGRLLFRRNFEPSRLAVHAPVPSRAVVQEVIPWHPATRRIVLREGNRIVAERTVSPNTPAVTLLSPLGGESWGADGEFTVAWQAQDADGDALYYWLQYSADGGKSWETVERNLQQTSYAIDLSQVAGSSQALLRLLATDGVNTAIVVSAPFVAAQKAPQVVILAPLDGAQVAPGEVFVLRGLATDYEDGMLGGSVLAWSSSLDGNLGTGESLRVALTPGEHTITLTGTDSDGQQGTDSIRLTVSAR